MVDKEVKDEQGTTIPTGQGIAPIGSGREETIDTPGLHDQTYRGDDANVTHPNPGAVIAEHRRVQDRIQRDQPGGKDDSEE